VYVILNKTRRFKTDITAWNRRPEPDKTWEGFKTHFRRTHQDFRDTIDVTLKDSELQRNNANLVQQVVNGMQQALAAETETETDANATLLLQEANQLLNSKIQLMQQSMDPPQTQVANQGSTQPYHDNYQNQGQRSGGYQQGYEGQDQQDRSYQQGRGYQGRGYQGWGYQGRNYQGSGRDGGRSTGVSLASATLRSIVGATAAAEIPAPPVCPSKMSIRTIALCWLFSTINTMNRRC
jgi:hypothetical protein